MHPRELATNDRIILALADAGSLAETIAAARRFTPAVGVFKVGLQLYARYGPELVRGLKTIGKVFLDLKADDTPDTIYDFSREATWLGVDFFTVRAEGLTALREARRGVDEMAAAESLAPPVILATTVLTSFRGRDFMHEYGDLLRSGLTVQQIKRHLAFSRSRDAFDARLEGLTVPASVIGYIREHFPNMIIVVPGMRLEGQPPDSHEDLSTPYHAIRRGADAVVIGRALTHSPDPDGILKTIVRQVETALEQRRTNYAH